MLKLLTGRPKLKLLLAFAGITSFLAAAALPAYYYFNQYQKTRELLLAQANETDEGKKLVDSLRKVVELPEEEPIIATVSDKTKLGSSDFLSKAENEDRIVIFSAAKKALIYRPSTGKIVEMANINIEETESDLSPQVAGDSAAPSSQTEESTPPKATEPVQVAILNGTKINGLTRKVESQLKTLMPELNFTIALRANAVGDYPNSLIVDLSGNNSNLASDIAAKIKGQTGSLPASEQKPEADLLIIAGDDFPTSN